MTEDKTYNGWTNCETWLVNLHLSNDQGLDEITREYAEITDEDWEKAQANEFVDDKERMAGYYADERFKDSILELIEGERDASSDPISLLIQDLIGTALADVDWRSVREAFAEPDDATSQKEDRRGGVPV